MEIVLKGVDPRTFNLAASLFAEILELAGAFALWKFLHVLISVYVKNGNKIPVQALGPLPGGLLEAWHYARNMAWAWPAALAVFLFISDYATSVAFAGMDFKYVSQQGPEAPVLRLDQRNAYIPYEATGDPVFPFTASKLEVLGKSSALQGASTKHKREILQLAREESMVASFLGAADAIARGESVFSEESKELLNDPTLLVIGKQDEGVFANVTDATVLYGTGKDSFLAGIDLVIPLDCAESEMVVIEEERGPHRWKTTSHTPNCTYTARRSSGLYVESSIMEITSYARVGSSQDTKLYFQGQQGQPIQDQAVFSFPSNGMALAQERFDFRQGRVVFGFGGVILGDMDIPFGATVLSAGHILVDPPEKLNPNDSNTVRTREYTLVAEVKDGEKNCPQDPSGSEASMCIVTLTMTCELFHSEIGKGGVPGDPLHRRCVFNGDVEIIWGTNFEVDSKLIAAVAGIRSRNMGWALTSRQKRLLSIHSIPAALFVMSSLDSRASVDQVKSTTIDAIFIAFMSVPALICIICGCLYLIGLKYLLPLPVTGGSLVEIGAKMAQQRKVSIRACPDFIQAASLQLRRRPKWTSLDISNSDLVVAESSFFRADGQEKQIEEEGAVVLNAADGHEGEERKAGSDPQHKADPETAENTSSVDCTSPKELGDSNDEGECKKGDLKRISISTEKVSYCSLFTKTGLGAWLLACMLFCITTAVFSGIFISSRGAEFETKRIMGQEQAHKSISDKQQEEVNLVVPPGCFQDNFHLGSTIWGYLHGSEDHRSSIETEYGPMADWCVDYVQDLSFLFAGHTDSPFINVSSWNVSGATMFDHCFHGFEVANEGLDLALWDVSNGQSFQGMFAQSWNFNGNLSEWDVSQGTDFRAMFSSAYTFNGDLSRWDVSSGTNFEAMFRFVVRFNSDLSQWNVSSGTNFAGMFNYATSFNSDLSSWDVSSGVNFENMFAEVSSFSSDLSNWDVSSGTDFTRMLSSTLHFTSDLSHWDVSSGTDFGAMFENAKNFSSDLSSWDVSSCTDFRDMFAGASNFNSDISQWDVSSGKYFWGMFRAANNFNSDISQWDVSSGTDFSFMFNGATNFNVNLCSWYDQLENAFDTNYMFETSGCPQTEITTDSVCQMCSPTPSPSSVPSQAPTNSQSPTSVMVDTVCADTAGWADSFGDGCEFYVLNGCAGAEFWANDDGETAYDACCVCGGGQ